MRNLGGFCALESFEFKRYAVFSHLAVSDDSHEFI